MTAIATLHGPVTAVVVTRNAAYATNPAPTGGPAVPTAVHHSMAFRIANRPVSMDGFVNLVDGDQVTAAGIDGPTFEILALRNDATRSVHTIPPPKPILAVVMILLGILTLWLMLIGVLFILLGVGYGIKTQRKKRLLAEALAVLAAA